MSDLYGNEINRIAGNIAKMFGNRLKFTDSEDFDDDTDDQSIDNSGVSVDEEENKGIYIHPVIMDDDKKRKWAVNKLNKSIKELEAFIPLLKEKILNEDDKAFFLINKLFPTGFQLHFYARNLSFNKKNGFESKIVGLRYIRESGDWLDTSLNLPLTKTLLFIGESHGRDLSINEISLIGNDDEKLDFEVDVTAFNYSSPQEVRRPFLDYVVSKAESLFKYTEKKLTEWESYLDWSENLARQRIKGCKYIGIEVDANKYQLIFTLAAHNKEYFDETLRYLKKGNVQAFDNNCSTDEWVFNYPKEVKRRIKGVDLGNCMGEIEKFSINEIGDKLNFIFNKQYRKNNQDYQISLADLKEKYGENAFFVKLAYKMNQDDEERLKDIDPENISELHSLIDEIITSYEPLGFLACSEVGSFALINRFRRTINSMKNGENFSPRLGDWLFDITKARLPDKNSNLKVERWLNSNIETNQNQKEAIEKMLNAPDIFLLQGPPGTGKTTVIAEAIYQFIIRGMRVLLASQSNDAVDNALERLASTPEIRAIRLDPRRRKDFINEKDEENAEKLSEDTAIQFYYKSLSSKINDQQAGWCNLEKEASDYDADLRNLNFFERDIAVLIKELEEKTKERMSYSEKQNYFEEELKKANDLNLSLNDDKRNLTIFKQTLINGEDEQFFLSESQIDLINIEFKKLNSEASKQWMNLIPNIPLESSNKEKNEYIKLALMNIRALSPIYDELTKNVKSQTAQGSPEIDILKRKKDEISKKLEDSSISEDDANKLTVELMDISKKIRDLGKGINKIFEPDKNQKGILGESVCSDIINNKENAIKTIKYFIVKSNETLNRIIKNLEEEISTRTIIDVNDIDRQLKSIKGKIIVNDEEYKKIQKDINQKRNTVINLSKKYELETADDVKAIINKINSLKSLNSSLQQKDKKLRDDWGDSLKAFQNKLGQHISDKHLIENDKEYFMSTYLTACNVVGISCTADPRSLSDKDFNDFDVVIIDEVSKATPPELLIPLMKGRKTVLVGDHRQLPPAFGENESSYMELVNEVQESDNYSQVEKELISAENFKKFQNMVTASLFKDYFEKADGSIKATLLTQYRMHSDIMDIINQFYENRLICGIKGTENETRKHLLNIKSLNMTDFIIPQKHAYWIDSSTLPDGSPFYESKIGMGTSSCNFLEEAITCELLKKIAHEYRKMGFGKGKEITVGVISFYLQSVKNLRSKVRKLRQSKEYKDDFSAIKISVNTVDRFQGQEKNIIIANLVRNWNSKDSHRMSTHITSFERINVAFSRAQNLLVVVGAQNLFSKVPVNLRAMDSADTRKLKVYSGIMSRLNQKGCFFPSSCLIDEPTAEKIKAEYKEANQNRGKKNYNNNKRFHKNNNREVKA